MYNVVEIDDGRNALTQTICSVLYGVNVQEKLASVYMLDGLYKRVGNLFYIKSVTRDYESYACVCAIGTLWVE